MSPLEKSGSKPQLQPDVESQIRNQKDFERFANVLWRGSALEIAQPTIVHKTAKASFILESRHLPFDGDISPSVLSELLIHIRSRYALVGLDTPIDRVFKSHSKQSMPKNGEREIIELIMINHGARPVELPKGAKPFHFFLIPPASYIQGEELEEMVGNEEGKAVYVQGSEGKDWSIDYETTQAGERLATGLYLRIDPEERFWIPPSEDPIRLPDEEKTTFQDVREFLLAYVFKKIDDPEFPMHRNGMWIGKGPHLTLDPDIYVKLNHQGYEQRNGGFYKVGMQTHSPLLEGGRTKHHPLVEIRGPANWVRATVIRNGEIAEPG